MTQFFGHSEFEAAASAVRQRTKHEPEIALVLGSGLGGLADSIENADVIPYGEIPHWPRSTVPGHKGELHIGRFEGHRVAMMQGRTHFYEGYPISHITLPIRVMQLVGVKILVLTNAAGGLNQSFAVGDLMLIRDHINLVGMAGHHPLRGPNDDRVGPRFPGMTHVYDDELGRLALEMARQHNVPMHEGIYVGLAGPSFETPAEIRFLRLIGADAVGMSTVAEATVARHAPQEQGEDCRLRVLGISGITNMAIDSLESGSEADHQEVLDAGAMLVPRLEAVLRGVLRKLA
jgi:purine-nucleoside phosphorylase